MSIARTIACVACLLVVANESLGQFDAEAPTYGTKWALVVGINYDSESIPSDKRLKHAQADAESFHKLLRTNYGFDEQHATLLLGQDADYDEIYAQVEKLWTNAKEEDCVLVYFSGHGFARDGGDNGKQGELLPADVKFAESVPMGAVVEMKWLVEKLGEQCKARHKLLILDCCKSGAVFSAGGRGASVFDSTRVDESVFRAASFQAMTASRELQQASDGKNGHSPFTDALLSALMRLPTKQKKDKPITTTELFSGMQWFLDNSLDAGQSPRCSWLDGGQGEFHFFPTGEFPNPDVPDDRIDKVMLAMVPGSFGLWWFEETPWFMPGLRYKILDEDADGRGVTRDATGRKMMSVDELEAAARKTRDRLAADSDERTVERVAILDTMLDTRSVQWRKNVDVVIERLKNLTAGEKADPVDLHYLAVLLHFKQAAPHDVKGAYENALKLYEQKASIAPEYKPLLALCLSDRGRYALDVGKDFDDACDHFSKARSVYGGITPQPFQIYVLCSEADALARLGRKGAAKHRLNEAAKAAEEIDPSTGYPLLASLYSRRAWLEMNWCEFHLAEENFAKSTEILSKPDRDSHDAKIMCFHNDHGMAMARRFYGNRDAALDLYRELLEDKIYRRVVELRENPGLEANYQQVRARLVERWVNTLERMGDCSLFGHPMDAAEAADDYRRGLQASAYLPVEKQAVWMRRLLSKRALSLALPNTPIRDLDMARESLQRANDLEQAEGPTIIGDRGIKICASLAQFLIDVDEQREVAASQQEAPHEAVAEDDSQSNARADAGKADLIKELEQVFKENLAGATLARDELEASLFALRSIVEGAMQPESATRVQVPRESLQRSDIDLLLRFCRLGHSGGTEALAFVRPYFNCAIDALAKLEPKDSKELIEIAWESLNGRVHFKPRNGQSTLLLYCSTNQAYFFLDIPRGSSSFYKLPAGLDLELIKAASQGSSEQLPLPVALKNELMAVPNGLIVSWHDRVNGLTGRREHRVASSIEEAASVGSAVPVGSTVPVGSSASSANATGATPEVDAVSNAVFPFAIPSFIRVIDNPPARRPETLATDGKPDFEPQDRIEEPFVTPAGQ